MIKKERLQALISNQSVIYYLGKAHWDSDSRTHIVKHKLTSARVKALGGFEEIVNDEYFFEHKEDAAFEMKYGCIKRVESISLPSYEELRRDLIDNGFSGSFVICVFDNCEFTLFLKEDGKGLLNFEHNYLPFTKENYLKMCEMVAAVYKGE